MELTMAAQEDSTPWNRTISASAPPGKSCTRSNSSSSPVTSELVEENVPSNDENLYGRSYFDVLGVVRRKPSRPDAPPTLSKSCSDKLALKQCTSTLSSISSLLIHPGNAYIHTLTLPSSQYVEKACQRSFGPGGRMASLTHPLGQRLAKAGYRYTPFEVKTTTREFIHSRRSPSTTNESFVPSNISSLIHGSSQETLINGVLQGRKQTDVRGASAVSRRKLWSLALTIATLLGEPALCRVLARSTYQDLKLDSLLRAREETKSSVRCRALQGWKRNSGDDTWSL